MGWIVGIIVVVVLIAWVVPTYNSLVQLRNKVKNQAAGSEEKRLISYEFFKTEVCRRVLNVVKR